MTALITPFANGKLDEKAFKALVERQVTEGTHAVVPCGTTGESPTLTHEERQENADKLIKHVKGKKPVYVHVGNTDLRSTAQLAVAAKESGADGIGVIPAYYYSGHPPTEIDLYFKEKLGRVMGIEPTTS